MYQNYINEVVKKYSYGIKNIFFKRKKFIQKKISNIPQKFLNNFNIESYLKVNPDIKEAIRKGKFINGLEHFILFGVEEVRNGKRRIGAEFPYYDEEIYLKYNADLIEEKRKNPDFDLYRHFLEYGYKEYLDGLRNIIGYFDFVFDESLQTEFKSVFDEHAYVGINPDVKEAIEKELFKNGWEHFVKYGVYEVRRGERQIHSKIPKFNEIEYFINFEDIQKAVRENKINSPFEHFLLYGYKEMLEEKRQLIDNKYYEYNEPVLTENVKKK